MDEKELSMIDAMLDRFEERQAAKAAKREEEEKKLAELTAKIETEVRAEVEEEKKAWKEAKGNVGTFKEATPGFGPEEQEHAFTYWMRSGDEGAAKSLEASGWGMTAEDYESVLGQMSPEMKAATKKALSEGTGTAGGVLVPDGFVADITEKRDNMSFVRQAGFRIIQADGDKIDVPTEDTSLAKFTRTAESGTFTTNDPSFLQNQITVHKWTKETRFTTELLEDDAADLEGFYATALARAMAQTEAYYVAIGTGTNQHQGIFVGGDTDTLTFDTATHIEPEEIPELFNYLKTGYRPNAMWLADNLTWQHIISLRNTDNWAWGAADMATINVGDSAEAGTLMGKRFYIQDDIDAIGTGKCVIMLGDPYYYALVERRGLSVARNPFLYMASGQVGFFSSFRQGGAVLVEEAFVGGVMA